MRRSDSAKGSGRKNRPLNTLKIAALLAIPKASIPTTIRLKPGCVRRLREGYLEIGHESMHVTSCTWRCHAPLLKRQARLAPHAESSR